MRAWCKQVVAVLLFGMCLPLTAEPAEDTPPIPVTIYLSADGRLTLDGVAGDSGPDDKELDLLRMQLKRLVDRHPLGAKGLRLKIVQEDSAPKERVVDVLNALAALGIRNATFTDLTKEDLGEDKK